MQANDSTRLGRTAHTLIGSLGTFGASSATSVARQLEAAAEQNNLATAAELLSALDHETHSVLSGLGALRESACPLVG